MANQTEKHKVAVVGSGNWGSTIAKILAENTARNSDLFHEPIHMWVFEEEVDIPKESKSNGKYPDNKCKLTEIINATHENSKYLPGITLPKNVIATPDIKEAVKDATIIIFNIPHQFMDKTLTSVQGHILPFARAISCVKGVDVADGIVTLYSELVMEKLGIYCGSLSGANIAPEVASENFCETTIGYDAPPMDFKQPDGSEKDNLIKADKQRQAESRPTHIRLQPMPQKYKHVDDELLIKLFGRPYFHVNITKDVAGVSLGGALKNIVALAAGFVAGSGFGENTKAAIIRLGMLEMISFGRDWFPASVDERTFSEESAGVADLIASCSGGRNFRSAMHAVQKGMSVDEIEDKELQGQKLQGTSTTGAVWEFLGKHGQQKSYPLFGCVHDILEGKAEATELPNLLANSAR